MQYDIFANVGKLRCADLEPVPVMAPWRESQDTARISYPPPKFDHRPNRPKTPVATLGITDRANTHPALDKVIEEY